MPTGEGNLFIGATVDVGAVTDGMNDTVQAVNEAATKLTFTFTELGKNSSTAFRKMSEDTKELAASFGEADRALLESAALKREDIKATMDLRRATALLKDGKMDEAQANALYAAAQIKVTEVSEKTAEAKRKEAEVVRRANEEEGLSENMMVRSFQLAMRQVKEASAEIQERMVEAAETGVLSAETMSGGFAGLGKLLGAGLAVGFAARFLDETAKVNIELGHMAEQTGFDIETLAGLKQMVKQTGAEWEPFSTALFKMSDAQYQAAHGNQQLAEEFRSVGITEEQVKASSPAEMLQLLAIAMAKTEDATVRAHLAKEVFGRAGKALIPILAQEGDHLLADAAAASKLTGMTNESHAASVAWTKDIAKLSTELQSLGSFIIRLIPYVEAVGATMGAAMDTAAQSVIFTTKTIGLSLAAIRDVATGNFAAMALDAQRYTDGIAAAWKGTADDVKSRWKEANDLANTPWTLPTEKKPEAPKEDDGDDENGTLGKQAVRRFEEELNHRKILHRMSVEEEIRFWKEKLAAAKEGTEEYAELEAKLAPLMERKGGGGEKNKFGVDELELNEQKLVHRLSIGDEIDFWEKKKDAAEKGSEEYRQIVARLASLASQKDKPEMQQRPDGDWAKLAQDEMIQGLEEESKAKEEANKADIDNFRATQEDKIRAAQETFQELESSTQFEVQMHRKTASERLSALAAGAEQELQIKQRASAALIVLDMNVGKAYQQDINKSLQASRDYFKQIQQINQQAALHTQTEWNKTFQKLNADMLKVTDAWMDGTKNMNQVFAKMYDDMLKSLVSYVAKSLLVHAEMWAQTLAMQSAGFAAQTAMNMQNIKVDAATAAANTYNAVSAIPVVGPYLAPSAAAAAYGAVMAFEMFEEGGIVGGSQGMHVPILAHAGERVLSAQQTDNFHELLNQRSQSQGSGGTPIQMHLTQHVNAYDRSGMRATLKAHASDLYDIINEGLRSGALAR